MEKNKKQSNKEGNKPASRIASRIPRNLPYSRTAFLRNFIAMNGLSCNDVARMLGVSSPAISVIFSSGVDDCRLSLIRTIADMCSHDLTVSLTRKGDESSAPPFNLDEFFPNPGSGVECEPLAFLSYALARYGISKAKIADDLGINTQTVIGWFLPPQDINISRLYQIAAIEGLNLRFDFTKRNIESYFDETPPCKPTEVNVVTTVTTGTLQHIPLAKPARITEPKEKRKVGRPRKVQQ